MFNQSSQSSLSGAFSSFLNSVLGVLLSLFHSVLAVFQAIFALGAELIYSALTLVRGLFKLIAELGQGLLWFVISNFVAILIVGVLYYGYTQYGGGRRNTRRKLKT